jgi:hypothetical protein
MTTEIPSKADKSPASSTRLNLNLSEKSRAELDDLAKEADCNLTQLVRFGLTLVKLYYRPAAPGEKLAIVKDGKLVKEILPPY